MVNESFRKRRFVITMLEGQLKFAKEKIRHHDPALTWECLFWKDEDRRPNRTASMLNEFLKNACERTQDELISFVNDCHQPNL